MKKITLVEIVFVLILVSSLANVYAFKNKGGNKTKAGNLSDVLPPKLALETSGGSGAIFGDTTGPRNPVALPKPSKEDEARAAELLGGYDNYDFGEGSAPTEPIPPPMTDDDIWQGEPRPGHAPAPVSSGLDGNYELEGTLGGDHTIVVDTQGGSVTFDTTPVPMEFADDPEEPITSDEQIETEITSDFDFPEPEGGTNPGGVAPTGTAGSGSGTNGDSEATSEDATTDSSGDTDSVLDELQPFQAGI